MQIRNHERENHGLARWWAGADTCPPARVRVTLLAFSVCTQLPPYWNAMGLLTHDLIFFHTTMVPNLSTSLRSCLRVMLNCLQYHVSGLSCILSCPPRDLSYLRCQKVFVGQLGTMLEYSSIMVDNLEMMLCTLANMVVNLRGHWVDRQLWYAALKVILHNLIVMIANL